MAETIEVKGWVGLSSRSRGGNCGAAFLETKILYSSVAQHKAGDFALLVAGEADVPYRSSEQIARDGLQDIRLVLRPVQHEAVLLDLQFIQRVYLFTAVSPGILFQVTCRRSKGYDLRENTGLTIPILEKGLQRASRFGCLKG